MNVVIRNSYLVFNGHQFQAPEKVQTHAPLAQLVEQLTLNQWVPGSNP